MAAPNLDEINVATTKKIMPGIVDNFFKNSPMLAYLKKNRYKVWAGGPQIQENFLYKPMKGGAYKKGASFDLSKRQTKAGLLFDPRFYQVNVTEYTEDVEVLVKGPQAVFSLVEADLANAALTMSAILAIAIYRHGQNVVTDRTAEINGLEEGLADGTNATFSGATGGFTSYGSQARVDVSPALNSPSGLIAANVNNQISYRVLEQTYQSCVLGEEHPKIGVTTNRCMGYINENFQPQQRIDTVEPVIGYTGIKFKDATIIQDQYCPGADGVNDIDIGNYNATNETFWWINPGPEGDTSFLNLYFASSPKYQFGFTGFKVAQDSTVVAGQILFGGTFTVRAPRLMRALFGITQ